MKTTLISFFALLLCLNTTAQSNFYKLSIGAGYGLTQSFTDVRAHDFGKSMYGTADFFFTPFISLGGELQMGDIKGGLGEKKDPQGRSFTNTYKAATVNGKLYLGALIDYDRNSFSNIVKWVYIGGGVGLIHNTVDANRVREDPDGELYIFDGKDFSTELVVPLNLGINFYFPNRYGQQKLAVNLNLQSNVTLGEGLDGYDDSIKGFRNSRIPDIYNYYTLGLKYHFGLPGLSKKSLY